MVTMAIIGAGVDTPMLRSLILSHSSNRSDIQVVTATCSDNRVSSTVTNNTMPNDYMDRTVIDINEGLRKMTMLEFDIYAELYNDTLTASLKYEDDYEYELDEVTYPPYQTPKKVRLAGTYTSTRLTTHSRGARNALRCNKILHVHRKRNRRNL